MAGRVVLAGLCAGALLAFPTLAAADGAARTAGGQVPDCVPQEQVAQAVCLRPVNNTGLALTLSVSECLTPECEWRTRAGAISDVPVVMNPDFSVADPSTQIPADGRRYALGVETFQPPGLIDQLSGFVTYANRRTAVTYTFGAGTAVDASCSATRGFACVTTGVPTDPQAFFSPTFNVFLPFAGASVARVHSSVRVLARGLPVRLHGGVQRATLTLLAGGTAVGRRTIAPPALRDRHDVLVPLSAAARVDVRRRRSRTYALRIVVVDRGGRRSERTRRVTVRAVGLTG